MFDNTHCTKKSWRLLWRPFQRTTCLILFIIFCTCTGAYAWELQGTVSDRNGAAVVAASIVSDIPGLGAVTDDAGRFTINSEGPRAARLTFSHIGFQPQVISLTERHYSEPLTITLREAVIKEQGITVYANRARAGETPVAYTDITAREIERDYTVGDLPLAMTSAPNVYTYSEAGSQLGYSHIAIRGFDERRISVYVNGVPLNDPEDHVTYFVDLPDFTGAVRDIQIQRGVGSSLYADGAFGGSVNIVSSALDQPRRFSFTTGIGEYWDRHSNAWVGQTTRQNLEFSSGIIDGRYHILSRFSRQSSGGYVENSWSNGWSYFMSASRLDPKSTTTFNTYGGPIRTHAAWDGIERDTYNLNRRANGLTYYNEGDNFNQPHYELHNTYQLNGKAVLTNTLYYIRGVGYYEQLKQNRYSLDFNIDTSWVTDPINDSINLVTQQWVRKNQLGLNSRLELAHDRGEHSFGIAGYYFDSDHWGQVNSASDVTSEFAPGELYYQYWGKKWNFSAFANERYQFNERLSTQLSLQLRHQSYDFRQNVIGAFAVGPNNDFSKSWTFASPRIGLNYAVNERNSIFGSVSISSRPPRDVDLYDANDPAETVDLNVESERLYDFELGYQYRAPKLAISANLFYMLFNDEVIFYGVDDDGSRLTDNAESSYHSGVELAASVHPTRQLTLAGNFSYNRNRYKEYNIETVSYGATTQVIDIDASDNTIPNFPEYIGNFSANYQSDRFELSFRLRAVGEQFVESLNLDSLSIESFTVSTLSGSFRIADKSTFGTVSLKATVDNIFDNLYLQSGYGGSYLIDADVSTPLGWAAYYPSAGRSFFVQLQLDML